MLCLDGVRSTYGDVIYFWIHNFAVKLQALSVAIKFRVSVAHRKALDLP
jgi:hypothetical protein